MLDGTTIDWAGVMAPEGAHAALIHRGATPASIAGRCCGLAYVATPYVEGVTHAGRWKLEKSADLMIRISHVQHSLLRSGCVSISPAVQWQSMAQASLPLDRMTRMDPLDGRLWAEWAVALRNACAVVVVPDVPGWTRSAAVWADVIWALEHVMPVHFMGAA